MLGLGKWKFHVEMFLFTGDIIVKVAEKNGEYVFEPIIEGFDDSLSYEIMEIKVKDNVITGTARASLIPGNKIVVATLRFEDDSCYATVDLPYFGKLDLGKGEKID